MSGPRAGGRTAPALAEGSSVLSWWSTQQVQSTGSIIRTTKDLLKVKKRTLISEFTNLVHKLKMVIVTAEKKMGFLKNYRTTLIKKKNQSWNSETNINR